MTRLAMMMTICGGLLMAACQAADSGQTGASGSGPEGSDVDVVLELTSDAFAFGDAIPIEHTCDGADLSPALSWPAGPDGTVGYALVVDDPDAPGGTWVHWAAWGIDETALPEGVAPGADAPSQGLNSWDETGYRGPCPPPGPEHNYSFRVYALDEAMALDPDATADDLTAAMQGHVLAGGELVGRFGR